MGGGKSEFPTVPQCLGNQGEGQKAGQFRCTEGVGVDPIGQRAISLLEASTDPAGTGNVKYQGFAEQNIGVGKQRTLQRFWIACVPEMTNLEAKIGLKSQARLTLKKFARF